MNVDMSVAPEIAVLAAPLPRQPAGTGDEAGAVRAGARPTIGTLAGRLRLVAGQPERWWGAVRFSHRRSEIADLEFPGFWVAVLAPGDPGIYCDCELMTVVAGEVTEESVAAGGGVTTALRPGPMRVHGQGQLHQIRAGGSGFAVSLHVRGGV
jgi:hypothetical protein